MEDRRVKKPIDYSVFGSGEDLGLSDDDDDFVVPKKTTLKSKPPKPKVTKTKKKDPVPPVKRIYNIMDSDSDSDVEFVNDPPAPVIKEVKVVIVPLSIPKVTTPATTSTDIPAASNSVALAKHNPADCATSVKKVVAKEHSDEQLNSHVKMQPTGATIDTDEEGESVAPPQGNSVKEEVSECFKTPSPAVSTFKKFKPMEQSAIESPVAKPKWTPPGPIGTQRNEFQSVNRSGPSVLRMGLSRNDKLKPLHPSLKIN